jgi:hypothetical protein
MVIAETLVWRFQHMIRPEIGWEEASSLALGQIDLLCRHKPMFKLFAITRPNE